MKLFGIKDTRTNNLLSGLFAAKREDLKDERDKLNRAEAETAVEPPRYCITYGPDHRHYNPRHKSA